MAPANSLPEFVPSVLPLYRRNIHAQEIQVAVAIPSEVMIRQAPVVDLWMVFTANKSTDELTCSIHRFLPKDFTTDSL